MLLPGESVETKGHQKRAAARVKLCQPGLGPDECTRAVLFHCSSFIWLYLHWSMSLRLTAPQFDHLFFPSLIATQRWRRPHNRAGVCEVAHFWCGDKLGFSWTQNNDKNSPTESLTLKGLLWSSGADTGTRRRRRRPDVLTSRVSGLISSVWVWRIGPIRSCRLYFIDLLTVDTVEINSGLLLGAAFYRQIIWLNLIGFEIIDKVHFQKY